MNIGLTIARAAGRRRRSLCLHALVLLCPWLGVAAEPRPATGQAVQAALVLQLLQFVEWPAAVRQAPSFPVCIVGNPQLADAMTQAAPGQTVGSAQVTVERMPRLRDHEACRVFVISAYDDARLRSFLATLAGRSVLTVGDSEAFLKLGGAISLIQESGRLGIQISPANADRSRLRFSSKLLRLSRVYQGGVTP